MLPCIRPSPLLIAASLSLSCHLSLCFPSSYVNTILVFYLEQCAHVSKCRDLTSHNCSSLGHIPEINEFHFSVEDLPDIIGFLPHRMKGNQKGWEKEQGRQFRSISGRKVTNPFNSSFNYAESRVHRKFSIKHREAAARRGLHFLGRGGLGLESDGARGERGDLTWKRDKGEKSGKNDEVWNRHEFKIARPLSFFLPKSTVGWKDWGFYIFVTGAHRWPLFFRRCSFRLFRPKNRFFMNPLHWPSG